MRIVEWIVIAEDRFAIPALILFALRHFTFLIAFVVLLLACTLPALRNFSWVSIFLVNDNRIREFHCSGGPYIPT